MSTESISESFAARSSTSEQTVRIRRAVLGPIPGTPGMLSTASPFSASLTGTRSDVPVRRTLGAALRGSALIRAHGIWLWARRLPVRPRPHHRQEGVR